MNNDAWLQRLEELLLCFPSLGASYDISSMTIVELWGLYCHLQRRVGSQT